MNALTKRTVMWACVWFAIGIVVGYGGATARFGLKPGVLVGSLNPGCAHFLNQDWDHVVPRLIPFLAAEGIHLEVSDPALTQCVTDHAWDSMGQIRNECRGGTPFYKAARLAITHLTDVACADEYQAATGR